jgi:AraC-like DNA-binding protein
MTTTSLRVQHYQENSPLVEKSGVSLAPMENLTPPQTTGVRLHWDGRSSLGGERGVGPVLGQALPASFQATGQPSITPRAGLYWRTDKVHYAPARPSRTIAWEQEAAGTTFLLDPILLAGITHGEISGATGELVWVCWGEQPASSTPSVRPALLVRTSRESTPVEHVTIVPSLTVHDPLVQHIALMLQAKMEGEGVAAQLYAGVLANALAVHFLHRYATSQHSQGEVAGGLSPYKLQRTIAYIREHLAQELSLVTLAAMGQASPAHFARLFKHSTGQTPHHYVIRRRMEQAQQLLAETAMSLSEIGLRVGCADQSHFTALFRKHIAMTPKAYRDNARAHAAAGHHRAQGFTDT